MKMNSVAIAARIFPMLLSLLLTEICSFVTPNGIRRVVSSSSTASFHASMFETDMMFNLEGEDPENYNANQTITSSDLQSPYSHKQADQIEIIRYNNRSRGKRWCPFHYYLHEKQRSIKNPKTNALYLDDELKRMQSRYHQLSGEDLPEITFPLSYGLDYYNGNIIRPNEQVYELVARAYSRASMGEEGIELAESVIERYEKFNPSQMATSKMMAFVMKTCIAAGNLERTDYWLQRIERRYEVTQRDEDLPGYYIYNPFIFGLKKMPSITRKQAAIRSMEVLEKVSKLSKTTNGKQLYPGRQTYLEVMKYQEEGYYGPVAFDRIKRVFRYLQKSYAESGNHTKLKPTAEVLAPVFVAASKCTFPHDDKIIKKANALFDEYDALYKETQDIEYCPNAIICNSLNSMYARLNRHSMNLTEFTERTLFLVKRMEEYNVHFKDPRDKTAVFNRILHATEYQLPDVPMSDPVKTKELFLLVLDIFKQFHSGDEASAPPSNKATYQIFLRACAKLPEGETRFKLSRKAFQLCRGKGLVTIETVCRLHDANPEYAVSLLSTENNLGFEKGTFDFMASGN